MASHYSAKLVATNVFSLGCREISISSLDANVASVWTIEHLVQASEHNRLRNVLRLQLSIKHVCILHFCRGGRKGWNSSSLARGEAEHSFIYSAETRMSGVEASCERYPLPKAVL